MKRSEAVKKLSEPCEFCLKEITRVCKHGICMCDSDEDNCWIKDDSDQTDHIPPSSSHDSQI